MVNGDSNENGIKINRSNYQKKIWTCSALFLPFFAVVLHDYNAVCTD